MYYQAENLPFLVVHRQTQSTEDLILMNVVFNCFTSYEKLLGNHYFKGMIGYVQELYNTLYAIASNNELYSDNILSTTHGTKISVADLNEQIAT